MAFVPSALPEGPRAAPGADPLRAYLVLAAGVGAVIAVAHGAFFGIASPAQWLPAFALYALGTAPAARAFARFYPHGALGLCNAVTQLRLGLVALLVSAFVTGAGAPWLAVGLATAALLLDGIDGWLARREALVSAVGARFDVEVDSALALTLALGAVLGGTGGALVLFLGLARYAFVAAGAVLPWLRAPPPERFSRKAVCVLQIATLVGLHVPVVPPAVAAASCGGAAAALAWSFGRDVLWLWRQERRRASPA
jgi:phosphatidylglycerophosphate synthase